MLDVDKLKTLIADGKIQETLLILRQIRDQSLQNEVFHLNARYTRYKEAERLQLKSSTELSVELNQLNKAVLDFIDHCTKDHSGKKGGTDKWFFLLFALMISVVVFNKLKMNQAAPGPENPGGDNSLILDTPKIKTPVKTQPLKTLKRFQFHVEVVDSILNTKIEGASVSAGTKNQRTQQGRVHFEFLVHSLDTIIEISVEKSGFKPKSESIHPKDVIKTIQLVKDENN